MKIQEIHKGEKDYPKALLRLEHKAPKTIHAVGNTILLKAHERITIFGDKVDKDDLDTIASYAADNYYIVVSNLSTETDKTIIDAALQYRMPIIAIADCDIELIEDNLRYYVDKILSNEGLVITACPNGSMSSERNAAHHSYTILAALADILYITEITKEMSAKVVRYAWWLHRPLFSSGSAMPDKTHIHMYINSRYELDKRRKEIMKKINNTDKRILVISNKFKDIHTELTSEVLKTIDGYELLDLYLDAYRDSETCIYDIAHIIKDLAPSIIMVNPNRDEIQTFLLNLWNEYPEFEQYSYFYCQPYHSIPFKYAERFCSGYKYEHHSGTNIRDVLDKAAHQIDVAEYAPVLDTSEQTDESENAPQTKQMTLMDIICRNRCPLHLVDEE